MEAGVPEKVMSDEPNMIKDIAISAGLGGMGITARHMIERERRSWTEVATRTGAAMITAVFAGFAADAMLESESMKYAAVGAVSYTAPEILSFLVKLVNKKGNEFTKSS